MTTATAKNYGAVEYSMFFVLFVLLSCNVVDKNRYYPKEQWYIPSSKYFPVRANPKQVTEYYYGETDSLLKQDTGNYGSYEEYIYDSAGNMRSRKLYLREDDWYLYRSVFSDEGMTSTRFFMIDGKVDTGLFMKVMPTSDGRYHYATYDNNKENNVTLYRYKENGNIVETEQHVLSGNDSTFIYGNRQYDGQRLLFIKFRRVVGKDTVFVTESNFYDKQHNLDSNITVSGKSLIRKLFMKNEQGDPLTELEISGRDTGSYRTYQYLYDAKGNWIRRVETGHLAYGDGKYYLLIRKIIY